MVSFSIFRLARFIRSIFVPTSLVIGFSCLLTFIFILYQPTPGPGAKQRLGWQSWDIVSDDMGPVGGIDLESSTNSSSVPGQINEPNNGNSGVDWWNVSAPQDPNEQFDAASLPLDVWDPLMPHDTGCT